MSSDFTKAIARISEGHCPLCEARLNQRSVCTSCDVGWFMELVPPSALHVVLKPTRSLKPDEIKKLYAR